MPLPPAFQFSQSSLQDYVDCPRRFYLKHIRRLAWPSIESEPVQENEHFRLQGELFHKMIHQFLIGIPAGRLSSMTSDPTLSAWWESFLVSQKKLFDANTSTLRPELSLTTLVEGFHLAAKYDLLVLTGDGSCLVYDWKTYRRRPRRQHLASKLQTRVYPFVLMHASESTLLFKKQTPNLILSPERLTMIYWYANFPDLPETFTYSLNQYQQDSQYLSNLILSIAKAAESEQEDSFPLTSNLDRCLFCVYRSLCDRGVRAGDWDEDLEDAASQASLDNFDFEHISEIEF